MQVRLEDEEVLDDYWSYGGVSQAPRWGVGIMQFRGPIRTHDRDASGGFQKGDIYVTNTLIRLIFNGVAWDYDRDLKVQP